MHLLFTASDNLLRKLVGSQSQGESILTIKQQKQDDVITFANNLDPDQARRNVGPDLDPNCLTPWLYS